MMDADVSTESQDPYENVFSNPVFEPDDESEQSRREYKNDVYCESTAPLTPGAGVLQRCVQALKQRVCARGTLIVFLAMVVVVSVLLTALLIILRPGDSAKGGLSPADSWLLDNRSSPRPTLISTNPTPTFFTSCGGLLTGPAGTLSSPNHPGLYPAHASCVWLIQVPPPLLVQIHISSLSIEGPSPCLFDWLEVQEETSAVTRFCGSVAPATLNTNSSSVRFSFHSDGSIARSGFMAQYRSISATEKSCSREEFLCDAGRCLLPLSLCDGHWDCWDHSDEQNCSRPLQACGGKLSGASGSLFSPNHPRPYPHQQRCVWQISVEDGQIVELRFLNFSLEAQDVCEFDFVEVFDGGEVAASSALGRFCGTSLPPVLCSSAPLMSVLFVADEGVADNGFYASFRAISLADRSCSAAQFSCSNGECLQQELVCDGWSDCTDGADEHNCSSSTYPAYSTSCELIQVEMCRSLSYNLTSFPNVWLSLSEQREAAELLHEYSVLQELACFESLRRLVCGMFLPRCSPESGVLQPCQSVCVAAEQQCSQSLSLLTFSWPFNCLLLPDSPDPSDCSLP